MDIPLWHCASSRKIVGSIPDGVIGIFHWLNPPGCTMALGSTQPLTEMSKGKGQVLPRTGHEGPEGE
jgi:hypothetical protein